MKVGLHQLHHDHFHYKKLVRPKLLKVSLNLSLYFGKHKGGVFLIPPSCIFSDYFTIIKLVVDDLIKDKSFSRWYPDTGTQTQCLSKQRKRMERIRRQKKKYRRQTVVLHFSNSIDILTVSST